MIQNKSGGCRISQVSGINADQAQDLEGLCGEDHVITAQDNQDIVLVSGLIDPQGIIFDVDGNLIVTDSGHHQLLKVLIH